jgi:hypothetical protein
MTINHNLPTFKGLTNDRPIQFLNDFEIRASALVGYNDSQLLQTVHQVLSDGALTWFSQLQHTSDRVTTWVTFKQRFLERYHTATQIITLRSELRLLFQGDTESTLDYYERLKTLIAEIDPDYRETWIKYKFLQKLRPDIRSRLDHDHHLPIRELVRRAQHIESTMEQQKVDDKLRLAAALQKKPLVNLLTNNSSLEFSASPYSSESPTSYHIAYDTTPSNDQYSLPTTISPLSDQ